MKRVFASMSAFMCLVYRLLDFISILFNKIFIKTKFHDTIYIFKNYFIIIFLFFNF